MITATITYIGAALLAVAAIITRNETKQRQNEIERLLSLCKLCNGRGELPIADQTGDHTIILCPNCKGAKTA